jgi:hypothetical protein
MRRMCWRVETLLWRAHDVLPDGTERVQTEAIRAVETEMT